MLVNKEYNIRIIGGNIDKKNLDKKEENSFFSAFFGFEGEVVISDPFAHRVIFWFPESGKSNYVYFEENSFPRWVIPYKDRYFFVDRNLNEIGFLYKNGFKIKKKIQKMESLISASIGYDGRLTICGRGEKPIAKIDDNLNVIEQYFDSSCNFQSAQEISDGRFLITDIGKNTVCICDDIGNIYWQHGIEYEPGNDQRGLLAPKYACMKDEKIYIADARNNRIKIIDTITNEIQCILGDGTDRLWFPTCIHVLNNKNILITDCMNKRVLEINEKGKKEWQFGSNYFSPSHVFDSPRMIEIVGEKIFVINAYCNNFIRITKENYQNQHIYNCEKLKLFWPKGIRRCTENEYFICDSRNGRVLIVDETMKVCKTIKRIKDRDQYINLKDPHDIDFDGNGNLVITDAGNNMIYIISLTGEIVWKFGENGELYDPHQCRVLDSEKYLIADSGHDRIIFVNDSGEIVKEISELNGSKLKKPRWCEVICDGYFLIADTGNNRVIILDERNNIIFKHGGEWGSGINAMRKPRCVKIYKKDILISDTENNRIIVLEKVLQ